MTRALLLTLLALGSVSQAHAATLSASKQFSADEIQLVSIDFPAGNLVISPSETDQIEVTMSARCKTDGCEERARRIRLVADTHGDTKSFRIEGMRKGLPVMPAVSLRFAVPRSLGVHVHMGAGDVDIRDVTGDVELELGAGDVEIHEPESVVHTVDVHVGVGDANLRVGSRLVDGHGFLSKNLHWRNDVGSAHVDVDLGAGDVEVALN